MCNSATYHGNRYATTLQAMGDAMLTKEKVPMTYNDFLKKLYCSGDDTFQMRAQQTKHVRKFSAAAKTEDDVSNSFFRDLFSSLELSVDFMRNKELYDGCSRLKQGPLRARLVWQVYIAFIPRGGVAWNENDSPLS